jgi:hypothetical protein
VPLFIDKEAPQLLTRNGENNGGRHLPI